MSCSKCCGFKPFFGKVDYVIRDYDPTEDFTDYTVPTWWINRKRKVAWFLVSKEGGKSLWVPLLFGAFINKILTRCGEILPENGQIEFKEGEGIVFACDGSKLTFSLAIPILAEYGGTGFTEYKLGDLLVGNLDGTLSKLAIGEKGKALGVKDDGTLGYIDIVQELNCFENPVTENALTRWNLDGSCLKDSKTVQDDQGNTITTSTVDKTLKQTLKNLSTNDLAQALLELVTSEKGTPILKLLAEKTQQYQIYIDRADKSLRIDGYNFEDPTQLGNFFRINRKGNVSHPLQFRALALLATNTPRVTGNGTLYKHGSTTKLTVLKDVGNQFYSGDGAGKGATFSVYEDNTYLMYMHITFNSFEDKQGEMINRVLSQSGRIYNGRGILAGGLGNNSVGLLIGIDAVMGDIFEFATLGFMSPNELRVSFSGTPFPNLTTYIGVYCLG